MRKAFLLTLNTAAAMALSLLGALPAMAHVCDDARSKFRDQVAASFDQQIEQVPAAIRMLETMPESQVRDELIVALQTALANAKANRDYSIRDVDEHTKAECVKGLQPLQEATDATVAIATGGLSLILPKRMTHIDVGELLDGNLMGGSRSVIRDIINKKLGLPW